MLKLAAAMYDDWREGNDLTASMHNFEEYLDRHEGHIDSMLDEWAAEVTLEAHRVGDPMGLIAAQAIRTHIAALAGMIRSGGH